MSAMDSIPHDDTPQFASAPIDASALLDATTRAAQGTVSPERFFDADYTPTLLALLHQIVAENAPLTEANLARMVAQRHGWQRTGGRIQARIAELHSAFDLADEDGVRFVWAKGSIVDRIPFRGMGERALRDISRTEIAALIDVHAQRLASSEDPELELARLCGIARLSKDAREYLGHCRAWQAGLDASP